MFQGRVENRTGPFASYGGFRWAQDHLSDGNDATAPQVLGGASWTTYQNRLKLRSDAEVDVGGGDSLEFPTRFLVGADFALLPQLTVFGEEELALAQVRTHHLDPVGLRTSPWQGSQVTAALGQQVGQDAQRLFTTVGALQTFQLSDAWSVDFAVDNSIT